MAMWRPDKNVTTLEGAHDSLVDCRGQADVVHQTEFHPFTGKIAEKVPVVDTDQHGRPVRATATLTNNLESCMTKVGKGIGCCRDLHANERAKEAKMAEMTHP